MEYCNEEYFKSLKRFRNGKSHFVRFCIFRSVILVFHLIYFVEIVTDKSCFNLNWKSTSEK